MHLMLRKKLCFFRVTFDSVKFIINQKKGEALTLTLLPRNGENIIAFVHSKNFVYKYVVRTSGSLSLSFPLSFVDRFLKEPSN